MFDSVLNRKKSVRAIQVQCHFIQETAHALLRVPVGDPGTYMEGQLTMSQGRQRYHQIK